MTNDCLVKTLKNIQDKNRSSFKQAEMRDAIVLSRLIGRHFFTILKFRFNGAAWLEIAEALSTCSEQSVTPTMLKTIFHGYIFNAIMLLVAGLFAWSGSLTGIVIFSFLFAVIPITLLVIHTMEILSEVTEEIRKIAR